MLSQWLSEKNALKCKILSLVGQLQYATKVVIHTHLEYMQQQAKLRKEHYYHRLYSHFHSDLAQWHTFYGSGMD